jgi:prepilin-type processing-associated H-X9-DG protein
MSRKLQVNDSIGTDELGRYAGFRNDLFRRCAVDRRRHCPCRAVRTSAILQRTQTCLCVFEQITPGNGLYKVTRIQQPTETIYFADNENGSWRPIFTTTNIIGDQNLNDVWSPIHLPYPSTSSTARLSGERRVAAARHGQGPNLMFFDGHAEWKNARRMTVDDWREQKY